MGNRVRPISRVFSEVAEIARVAYQLFSDQHLQIPIRSRPLPSTDRIGIWRCWVLWRQEKRRTRRKPLEARREPTANSTHIWHRARIKPEQH